MNETHQRPFDPPCARSVASGFCREARRASIQVAFEAIKPRLTAGSARDQRQAKEDWGRLVNELNGEPEPVAPSADVLAARSEVERLKNDMEFQAKLRAHEPAERRNALAIWEAAHRAAYPSPQRPEGDSSAKEAIEASLLLLGLDQGMKELLSGDRASQQHKIAVQKWEALHRSAAGASAPQEINDEA